MVEVITQHAHPDPHGTLEAKIGFILKQAGVPVSEIDQCMIWAFGIDWAYLNIATQWADRWIKRHPGLPVIVGTESFVETVFAIGTMYLVAKQKAALKIGRG